MTTTVGWVLSIYATGLVLALLAAMLVAARESAFDRVHPNRDPVERSHDGEIQTLIAVIGIVWPFVPLLALAWLGWRGVVLLFELPMRRKAAKKDQS